MNRTKIKLKL